MSTIKVTNIEHGSTTDGGIQLDNAGHVTVDGQQMPTAGPLSNRNLIINGAMNVAQRGTTSSNTLNYCSLDRYRVDAHRGAWEFSQESLSSGDPYNLGFRHFARLKNTTVTTDNDRRRRFLYYVEAQDIAQSGWNYVSTSSFITVSFWVRSSVAGTYYFYVQTPNSNPDKSFHFSKTLVADTWTKVEQTFPGDSSLIINNDNSTGFRIVFNADHGTDFTGSISLDQWITFNNNLRSPDATTGWSNTSNATFDVTGVQLEVGEKATPFEHRSYGDELARCQRYYYMIGNDRYASVVNGTVYANNNFYGVRTLPVSMRTAPTLDTTDATDHFTILSNGTDHKFDSIIIGESRTTAVELRANSSVNLSGVTAGHAAWMRVDNASAHIAANAEL